MRVVGIVVVVACGSGALGWLIGSARAEPSVVQARAREDAPTTAPARSRLQAPLVCAATRTRSAGESDCGEAELRTRWCESELDQCASQRRAVRHDWPADATIESPEDWTAAIDEALADCEIGAELELVDCAEYPCTAALRPADTAMSAEAHEHEMQRLMAAVQSCEPLRQRFGVAEDAANLDVYRLDARCDGGREAFFALVALDLDGEAYRTISKSDKDDFEERDTSRWMYRRADDLAGLWPCGS